MKHYAIYKMHYVKHDGIQYRNDLEPMHLLATQQEMLDFFGFESVDELNGENHGFKDIKKAVHTKNGYTVIEA